MSRSAVFVTGGSGFVGRRLVPALVRTGRPVVTLARSGAIAAAPAPDGVTACRGDLLVPDTYVEALRGCDLVVHLAAATGKASAADHHRVNALGTAALVDACRQAGVPRMLFVSSIAVTFADQTGYHYAKAKGAAEETVRRSGLRSTIVRPTMIFGEGSPVAAGLAALALLPVVVVPGTGRVRVQPIHVDDLVAAVVEIVAADRFAGEVIEAGGPEVLAVGDLLQAMRVARRGAPGRVVRLPLALMRPPVLLAERAGLGPWLPVTAGQLASFANDGTAAPSSLAALVPARMVPVPAMLGAAPAAATGDAVDREVRVFTRHLIGVEPDAFVRDAYRQALARVPALQPKSAFDALLLARAGRGRRWARVADAYAALFARDSALRRRLVMTLAILETRAPFHQRLDAPAGPPGIASWLRVGVRVAGAVLAACAGALVFLPARAAIAILPRGGR